MTGIAGIIGNGSGPENKATLDAMLRSMSYEKFHRSGAYANEELGVWAGYVTGSEDAAVCMPLWNERRDAALFFTGDCFPDVAELKELEAKGYPARLLAAYSILDRFDRCGTRFLAGANGWFSGLLVDLRQRQVHLFVDRFALRRLYYHERKGSIYFASEAKAILAAFPDLRHLHEASLGEVLTCHCVIQNKSLFEGIHLVPCASLWTFSPESPVKKKAYFSRDEWENQPTLDEERFRVQLKETLARVLPRYFRAGDPIGISLTGGLDGRTVMAFSSQPPGTLPCYTFGSPYRDCADVKLARRVAAACGQSHRVIRIEGDFFNNFPALAAKAINISDGTMDVNGAVELYINRLACQIAPVRMTGNDGSEILRGNMTLRLHPLTPGIYDPEMERLARVAYQTYSDEADCSRLSFIAFKQVPWCHHARFTVEQSQIATRTPFLDIDLIKLMYQAPREAFGTQFGLRLIAEQNPALEKIPTDRGLLRNPVPVLTELQHLFQELTVRAEYLYDYGMPQWFCKFNHWLEPLLLERLFLGRHKFYHFKAWYRGQLAGYVREMLLDPITLNRPYIRRSAFEKAVCRHLRGEANYTLEISQVLSWELIQRQFIDHASYPTS